MMMMMEIVMVMKLTNLSLTLQYSSVKMKRS